MSGAPSASIPPSWSTCSTPRRSEEHTSELQSRLHLVCRLLLEKKKAIAHDRSDTLVSSVSNSGSSITCEERQVITLPDLTHATATARSACTNGCAKPSTRSDTR